MAHRQSCRHEHVTPSSDMEHPLHDGDGIVVEDGGHVFGWELVRGVADQQARLPHGTVPNDNASAQSQVSQVLNAAYVTTRLLSQARGVAAGGRAESPQACQRPYSS
jgi:hypothetical protein